MMKKRFCYMCKNKIESVDPTNVATLSHYVSFYGTIEPREKTKLCQKHQKKVSLAIKKARELGLKIGSQE